MNETETDSLFDLIKQVQSRGITVLIIEHDMPLVMKLCDRITVLNFGEKLAEGTPDEIQNNEAVIEAYLGKEEDEDNCLKLTNIETYYGQIQALKGIDLEVNEGKIITLLGANGAGKSTTMKTIAGLIKT